MSAAALKEVFDRFARRLGCEIRHAAGHPAVTFVDLESQKLAAGYVRLCVDTDDAVAIVETAVPLSTLVEPDADPFGKLFALQAMTSPPQSGKRLFPVLDMQTEHLVMTYVAGADAVRNEEELAAIVDGCTDTVTRMLEEARKALQDGLAATGLAAKRPPAVPRVGGFRLK
jgi:hypothetical protein